MVQKALADQKGSVGLDEPAILTIGKAIAVEKTVLTSLEKFGDTIALNIRIVDVNSALIDYTENVFIKNENLLFDALKEVVTKVVLRYSTGKKVLDQGNPDARKAWLKANWVLLGAKDEDLNWLVGNLESPEDCLGLRQYDIGFTPASYVEALRTSVDLDVVRGFFQAGVSWPSVQKALSLGISKLDVYRQTFQPAGYAFDDYLTAFEHKISTPHRLRKYLDTFEKDFLLLGLGGVAADFPIATSKFKFVLGQVAWEHFWTESLQSRMRFGTEAGVFLLNIIDPAPYIGFNFTMGSAPFYGKVGIGEHADVLVGGSLATHIRVGFEILNQCEMTILAIPFGTQPKVSYVDLTTPMGNPGYVGITYPCYGVMFTYKIPVGE